MHTAVVDDVHALGSCNATKRQKCNIPGVQTLEGNAWHADHVIPVYKGGGMCQLDNLRTLCVPCHQVSEAPAYACHHGVVIRTPYTQVCTASFQIYLTRSNMEGLFQVTAIACPLGQHIAAQVQGWTA